MESIAAAVLMLMRLFVLAALLIRSVDAMAGGASVTVAAAGDLLLHEPVLEAERDGRQSFESMWHSLAAELRGAEVTYLNLEGTVAPGLDPRWREIPRGHPRYESRVYTGYPRFNYPPRLLDALAGAGVDIVSTANNHSLDRGPIGLRRTAHSLRRAGLAFHGTRPSRRTGWGPAATKAGSWRLAWIACTFLTNRDRDDRRQVLHCYRHRSTVQRLVREAREDPGVDAVIVTPHWGRENSHVPRRRQRRLARELIGAGAHAVIGTHPHFIQPLEWVKGPDGLKRPVLYSTGNFISGQDGWRKRVSVLARLKLARRPDGKVDSGGIRVLPLWMRQNDRFEVLPLDCADEAPSQARALIRRIFPPGRVASSSPCQP